MYDIIIPVAEIDIEFFKKNISITISNLKNHNRIFVITRNPSTIMIENCIVVGENLFPFSKKDVSNIVGEKRAGWYFQQLLKLYSPLVLNLDNFVILDADVVILNNIEFFDSNNNIVFNSGTEYHVEYFNHIKRVAPFIEKVSHVSGICHYMPMKSKIVKDLISKVEQLHSDIFWKIMLQKVDPKDFNGSGMSEYEMLFNFTLKNFPNDSSVKRLEWKNASNILDSDKDTFSYVSVHWYIRQ
jgi:hypothetical protein